jgi:hypothetical protein
MRKTLAGAAVIRIPFVEATGHRAKMTTPMTDNGLTPRRKIRHIDVFLNDLDHSTAEG